MKAGQTQARVRAGASIGLCAALLLTVAAFVAPVWGSAGERADACGDIDCRRVRAKLRPLAEHGIARAQTLMGILAATGRGEPRSYERAAAWWTKAARQGDADAQDNLAILYANGWGVAKDDAEAVHWWRASAEQGHAHAQYNLGVRYHKGQGIERDETVARRWWLKAACQGEAKAQYNLAIASLRAQETGGSTPVAYKWLVLAADGYADEAARSRVLRLATEVRTRLSAQQVEEAENLVRRWRQGQAAECR